MSEKKARDLAELIEKKESRRMEGAAKKGRGIISWLGMFGIVGWSVTVPLLLGIIFGKWLDRLFPGTHSFTLMFMFAGLCLGCVNAWFWVRKALGEKEVRSPESGVRNQGAKVRNQGTEVRSQVAEVRSQGPEVKGQESGDRNQDKKTGPQGPEEKNG